MLFDEVSIGRIGDRLVYIEESVLFGELDLKSNLYEICKGLCIYDLDNYI